MKKLQFLIILLVVGALFVPTASAEIITILPEDLPYSQSVDKDVIHEYKDGFAFDTHTSTYTAPYPLCIYAPQIQRWNSVSYLSATVPGDIGSEVSGATIYYRRPSDNTIQSGSLYVQKSRNFLGVVQSTCITIFPHDWSVGTATGSKLINIYTDSGATTTYQLTVTAEYTVTGHLTSDGDFIGPVVSIYKSPNSWAKPLSRSEINYAAIGYMLYQHSIDIDRMDTGHLDIEVSRYGIYSTISAYADGVNVFSKTGTTDIKEIVPPYTDNASVSINASSAGQIYTYQILAQASSTPTEPTTATATIYVRNSQTGAAIANSRCVIDALVDGEYLPVMNRTEPSGVFSVTLQPTGGGLPNPDGYRLIASADGYINPLPEINFTVDEYTTSIYCYLDPISGGPLDENKTFIDFFVRDMSANPISGATVNFGGYTLLTNSHGYTVFEVGKNATYTYTVSKSGYGSLTGNVVIGDDPRHTINTVLAPAVTPTTTTPIPTSTAIGPTPTLTAPTGEPASNLLEWFAAHFGMILGGGVEIGKIFMWLCFTVPVGVYVGKEAKAGAAGFMAGAGIVTLFFVIIGWVPIWLVVLLVLIIGLLYAKVFNTPDNGGGR